MIFKSYIIENNNEVYSQRFFLFYGENLGLKKHFKNKIKKKFDKSEILNYSQDEIIKNKKILRANLLTFLYLKKTRFLS